MEYILCQLKYVGKSEIAFNLGLNNHKSDVFDKIVIPACIHFAQDKHRFNKYPTFTLKPKKP